MTAADIGILTVAAVVVAAFALLLADHRRLAGKLRNADVRCDNWRAAAKTADKLVQRLRTERDDAHASLEDMMARLTRIADELETTERRGEQAAVAGMTILAKEREDFLESLQAWQSLTFLWQNLTFAALLPTTPALPAAVRPPELLPSGHALIAGDPDVLIHPDSDDLDVMSLPLPRGTS